MGKLFLIRHGKSEWNKKNIFTGWVDVPLAPEGVQEALNAGKALKGVSLDAIYVSKLIRAQMTALLLLEGQEIEKTPVVYHEDNPWYSHLTEERKEQVLPLFATEHLNERYYGDLQGEDKDAMREKYGKEQVHRWRRSFDEPPPNGESLKMTIERGKPFFEKKVMPHMMKGETIMLCAHGNSLRGMVMQIENLSPEAVMSLEIPTGVLQLYSYDEGIWRREDAPTLG